MVSDSIRFGDSSCVERLAKVEAEVLAAEREPILKQHLSERLAPGVSEFLDKFVSSAVGAFEAEFAPVLRGAISWAEWSCRSDKNAVVAFIDSILSCGCIVEEPWYLKGQDRIAGLRSLRRVLHSVLQVLAAASTAPPSALGDDTKELFTLLRVVTDGLGLDSALEALVGEPMIATLRDFERGAFSTQVSALKARIAESCVEVVLDCSGCGVRGIQLSCSRVLVRSWTIGPPRRCRPFVGRPQCRSLVGRRSALASIANRTATQP